MGMYTEIFFRAELLDGIPKDVTDLLELLITGDYDEDLPEHRDLLPDHEFFECSRFESVFTCSSAYFPTHAPSYIKQDSWGDWDILVHADLKNYSGEIGKFFGWIQDYVKGPEGAFLGYSLYEEDEDPILYYKNAPSAWKFLST